MKSTITALSVFALFNLIAFLNGAESKAYAPCSGASTVATKTAPVVCAATYNYSPRSSASCVALRTFGYTITSGTCASESRTSGVGDPSCDGQLNITSIVCHQTLVSGTVNPIVDDNPVSTPTPKPATPSPTPFLSTPTPPPVTTTTNLPDLVPTGLLQTSSASVALQFQNLGSSGTGSHAIRLEIPSLSVSYTTTAVNAVPAAGKTGQSADILKKVLKLDSCIPGEVISVIATVDATGSVRESNESNNQAQFKFQCPVAQTSCTNACPKGLVFNSATSACECPATYIWDSTKLQCVKATTASGLGTCGCPSGYHATPDGSQCEKLTSVPFAKAPVTAPMVKGDTDAMYFENAVLIDNGTKALPSIGEGFQFQVTNAQGGQTPAVNGVLGTSANVMHTNAPAYKYWQSKLAGVNGGDYGNSPLAVKIGYATGAGNDLVSSQIGTYTKAVCIDNTVSRNYIFHVGGDNSWQMRVDGVPYAVCSGVNANGCYWTSAFINQYFPAGKHLVELQYTNLNDKAAIWFQILANRLDDVKTAGQAGAPAIDSSLFSTGNLKGISSWDYQGTSPCPPDYAFDNCSTTKMCTKIEHVACTR